MFVPDLGIGKVLSDLVPIRRAEHPLFRADLKTRGKRRQGMQRNGQPGKGFRPASLSVDNHQAVFDLASRTANRFDETQLASAVGDEVLEEQHSPFGIAFNPRVDSIRLRLLAQQAAER